MFEKNKNIDPEIVKALSLITQLGLTMIGNIVIFLLIGRWLDRSFETENIFMIISIGLGLISGIYLNYRLLRKYYEKQ